MSKKGKSTNINRTLLLYLVFPTPNGKLHLGHIGGPYLKLDVIKRYNQQIGNKAYIYGGTDSYDSYVLLKALDENKKPEEICEYYHQCIKQDLLKMNIALDDFVNPLHEKELFSKIAKKIHDRVVPFTISEQESYPFTEERGFLPPSFITGNCPNCEQKIHSFICEHCGLYFKPEQAKNLSCKTSDNMIEFKKIHSVFLPIQTHELTKQISSKTNSKVLLDKVATLCSQTDTSRLTIPISWGVETGHKNSVFYTYGNFFHYLYTLGEKFKEQHQLEKNPLDELHTDKPGYVETVASFGFDNIMSFMINTLNYAITIKAPGLTHYLPSYFLTLDGEKFSTSRKHAIWVDSLANEVSIDILRFYLLKINVDNIFNDFKTNEFIDFHNQVATRLTKVLGNQALEVRSGLNSLQIKALYDELIEQSYAITMPENYSATQIYHNLTLFLAQGPKDSVAHALWLKCFAVLFYPVMPELSGKIWSELGFHGFPNPNESLQAEGYHPLDISIPLISIEHLK